MVGPADNFQQAPGLVFADRSRLGNPNDIPDVCFTLSVVGLELMGSPHALFVKRVFDQILDRDDDGLLHFVAHDAASFRLQMFCHLLFLCFPFSQQRFNPRDFTFHLAQSSCVFGLAGGEAEPQSNEIVFCILESK